MSTPVGFHVLGAFDRFNYGDLLFAWIAENVIQARYPAARISYYGTHAFDLSMYGAYPTQRMATLYKKSAWFNGPNVVFVSGGEVLDARWRHMYEHNSSRTIARLNQRLSTKRAGIAALNAVCQRHSGTPTILPWVPNIEALARSKRPFEAVYNSVGGMYVGQNGPEASSWQSEQLGKAAWISVRDRTTQTRLQEMLRKPIIAVPDSAVIMADLQDESVLDVAFGATSERIAGPHLMPDKYIAFQCGIGRFGPNRRRELAGAIKAVHEETGLPIVGFAIGRASGHEDHIVAAEIHAMLGRPEWYRTAPEDMTIHEIMSFIAHSACYVGSSMHGYITAFSFSVPRVGIGKIAKMKAFRDAWDLPDMPAQAEIADLTSAVMQARSIDRNATHKKSLAAVRIYRDSVEEMWAALEERLSGTANLAGRSG